jgi:hypothetical protein
MIFEAVQAYVVFCHRQDSASHHCFLPRLAGQSPFRVEPLGASQFLCTRSS